MLTQYGSFSLDQHLRQAWDIMHPDLGEFIYSMPPQQIMVSRWYRGTADSIFQNLNLLEAERPEARVDPLRRSRLQAELPGDAGFSPAPGART